MQILVTPLSVLMLLVIGNDIVLAAVDAIVFVKFSMFESNVSITKI
jgi:hypothetical protein